MNLEWRQTVWTNRWFVLGYTLFTDAGAVWDEGFAVADAPLMVGAGGGPRLSFPWFFGAPIARFDVAYGFRSEYVDVSFSWGNLF
jgi:hypothetical protein